jgi:hypothetical protein
MKLVSLRLKEGLDQFLCAAVVKMPLLCRKGHVMLHWVLRVRKQKNTSSRTTHCSWLLSSASSYVLKSHFSVMRVQADALNGRPDNRETTRFRRKHINLIGALSNIAKQAFDSIGRLNGAMHGQRELVKREGLLFFLNQASHRLPDSVCCIWL